MSEFKLLSALTQRLRLGRNLGESFGGKRNLYDIFGYDRTVCYEAVVGKYHRQDVTARIIDAPADALWNTPPKVTIEGMPQFDAIWEDLIGDHELWSHLARVDKLAGMGDFAILLLGLATPGDLDKPLRRQDNTELLYLQPYAVDTVKIHKLVTDPTNARYQLPELYQINPSDEIQSVELRTLPPGFKAHADRVVHVVENPLTNTIFGNPRGVKVFNLLQDLLKVVGGTAETFWLVADRGMHINVDKEMELTEEDAKNLSDEMDEYYHQLRRFIRTRGVDVNVLGSSNPDPKNTFEMLISLISGATGIPKRILLGSEAGQLASEQDRSNWADRIEERREAFGNPTIKALVMQLSKAGVLPEIRRNQINIEWPDAFQLSPLERAQDVALRARAAQNLAKAMDTPFGENRSGLDSLGFEEVDLQEFIARETSAEVDGEEAEDGAAEEASQDSGENVSII